MLFKKPFPVFQCIGQAIPKRFALLDELLGLLFVVSKVLSRFKDTLLDCTSVREEFRMSEDKLSLGAVFENPLTAFFKHFVDSFGGLLALLDGDLWGHGGIHGKLRSCTLGRDFFPMAMSKLFNGSKSLGLDFKIATYLGAVNNGRAQDWSKGFTENRSENSVVEASYAEGECKSRRQGYKYKQA